MGRPLWRDLRRARRERSAAPGAAFSNVASQAKARLGWAVVSTLVAIAAIVGDSNTHNMVKHHLWPKHHGMEWRYLMAAVFLIAGSIAVRRIATQIGRVVTAGGGAPAGAALRLFLTILGLIVVVIVTIGLLGVSPTRLLAAAGITGVILGLAAQQSLGNVFAGIVLMVARPFVVGQRIRVRSGSFGGIFEGQVRGMGLTYVEILVDEEGLFRVPNLGMLAAAVGPALPEKRDDPSKQLYVEGSTPKRPPRSQSQSHAHARTHHRSAASRTVRLPRDVIRRMRERRSDGPDPDEPDAAP